MIRDFLRRSTKSVQAAKTGIANVRYDLLASLSDRVGAARLRSHRPGLSEPQARVLGDLRQHGIAMIPFLELFGDPGLALWTELQQQAQAFSEGAKVKAAAADYRDGSAGVHAEHKPYMVRHFERRSTISSRDPVLRMAVQGEILDPVNAYLGLWSKLGGIGLFYTVPLDVERPRVASQNWHRDPEDRTLVKVFLYFTDVDSLAGPLEYIPGSRPGGPYAHLWPETTRRDGYKYPPAELIEREVPTGDRVVCLCPAGTLVFCDTSGFHRGGYARRHPRVFGAWMCLRPAARFERTFRVDDVQGLPLSAEARFSLK